MKHLIAAVALTTLLASPALAQSWEPEVGSGNTVPAPYGLTLNGYNKLNGPNDHAANAFAQAPRTQVTSKNSNYVTDMGGHVQADPDLNIRSQLQREGADF
jgi:hypothetical protein